MCQERLMIVLLRIATFDFLELYITEHECVQFRVLTDMVGVMSDELGSGCGRDLVSIRYTPSPSLSHQLITHNSL